MFSNRYLYKLIIPLIIEQVLTVTVGMSDVIMVSSIGESAVSGVSLVDMINVLIINVFAALATGGAVVSSQFLGEKDRTKACESANQLIIVTIFISLIITLFCILFRKVLLTLVFGKIDADVMNNAIIYFMISALSYPFIAVYNSCAALFRSMGNSKISMFTSLIMNIINISGNAVFIFIFNMGAAGAAAASLISRMTASIIMIILIHNSKNEIYINKNSKIHINFNIVKRILGVGIPNGLENGMFQFGRVIVVSIISGFGTVQIAANAVANNIDSMGCIPGQALSLAIITVVGQCVGAKDYNMAEYYTKKLLKMTYKFTIILNSFILLLLPLILKIYNLSPDTIKLASILIFIHNAAAMVLWPASFTLPNALRASNDVKYTMIVSIFSMWTFRIVSSYIIGKWLGLGAIGVWIAMIMDWGFRVICFTIRFFRGKWKLQKIS